MLIISKSYGNICVKKIPPANRTGGIHLRRATASFDATDSPTTAKLLSSFAD